MKNKILFFILISLFACKSKVEKITPTVSSITESIYASGIIKSKNQYQAFATVNGIIDSLYVSEGDVVKKGSTILTISNETQRLNKENAELAARFADFNANQGKLNEAKLFAEFSKNKFKNDSILYARQKNLWEQQVGSKVEFEQRGLAYENSKATYVSAVQKYEDLKRQLDFTSSQSKKNLLISDKLESDFTLKSEIDGTVYDITKSKGEIIGPQTPLAIVGDSKNFILEMQVDEYDILKIKKGLTVLITMDTYKGQVFEAVVTKIYPIMNERSKTFLVEAEFKVQPEVLYPNTSFEANIVLQTKEKAILIPRNFLLNDSLVVKANGDKVKVTTGLKDYQKIEILTGISSEEELIKPKE